MSSATLLAVSSALACLSLCLADSSLEPPFPYCGAKLPVLNNCSSTTVLGDWLLVYSSDISYRKTTSIYGPAFPYDFCDPMNVNRGCMAIGLTILANKDNKTVGYAYGYNAFTDTWTVEQFSNLFYQVPGTNLYGYRITYLHYVQVADEKIFIDKKPAACGKDVVRSGPIYRSSNFVILANAPDFSWVILLYCDSFSGFIDNAPLIQVLVKREYLPNVTYPFSTMPFYNQFREIIKKNEFNFYANDLELVYHDENGVYPTSVSWESIQWEGDCLCTDY